VTFQGADTFPRAPVPDTEGVVHASGDKLNLITLQRTQPPGVTLEATDLLTSLKIPYASCAIIRTRDENRERKVRKCFAELEAHDTIGVAL